MRRSVPFVICIGFFALSTGLTLVALTQTVVRPSASVHNRSAETAIANVALVRHFYSAATMVLITGNATLLDAMLAADLTEHPARPGAASGRDGFVRALLALRATFPGLKLVVDDVRAAGEDQVLVRVHAEGDGVGVFLGRPAPASAGQWGPLEVWRLANGQLVERWSDSESTVRSPLGQVPVSIDALGPGRRTLTVTRMIVEPGATLPVDNGQAIRVFIVDDGVLTVDVATRPGGMVALAYGSAMPATARSDETFVASVGDRVVTAPEAGYTLTNAGRVPAIILVVIVSNMLEGEWPLNSAAAAASWTVAAMPDALGGALPSPSGISFRILAADVEVELPEQSMLALGWMFLASGATLALPAGDGAVVASVLEGRTDLTVDRVASEASLASGEWTTVPAGVESLWQAGDESPVTLLMLTVGQGESAR